MHLHLLLTPNLYPIPETTKIVEDFGRLEVHFPDRIEEGLNCFVEDTQENIVKWLKPFDGVVVGVGSPMLEQFKVMHIKE